jgi:hypothetical protein
MRSTTRSGAVDLRSLVTVSAMPDESHASSLSPLTLAKSRTAIAGCWATAARRSCRRLGGRARRRRRRHRRDEPVASPRDSLDVHRLGRVVSEGLTQFRDGLREGVVCHRDVRPERLEEVFLRDERGLTGDEI